jgi:hypothetical protein
VQRVYGKINNKGDTKWISKYVNVITRKRNGITAITNLQASLYEKKEKSVFATAQESAKNAVAVAIQRNVIFTKR